MSYSETKTKDIMFSSIFGALILGLPLNWYLQNVFIKNSLSLAVLDFWTFFYAQGYFVAVIVLGLFSLLGSFIYDRYLWVHRGAESISNNAHRKGKQKNLFRILTSLRLALVVFTCVFWIQLIEFIWLSRIRYVYEIGFPLSFLPFLLLINFVAVFILLVFEPGVPAIIVFLIWLSAKYKFGDSIELMFKFIIRIIVYLFVLLIIFWCSMPSFLVDI